MAPLGLALAGVTLLFGLTGVAASFSTVFSIIREAKYTSDAVLYRETLAEGAYESLGVLGTGTLATSVQLIMWALAVRRARARI